MSFKIEKSTTLEIPVSRVWAALTEYNEFGEWFRVKVEAPFEPGQVSRGHITYPGYEHLQWQVTVKQMIPEKYFSFTWHPYAIDPTVDYSREIPTLVEFSLRETTSGTHLEVVESGFENVPEARRAEAFRMNDGGWSEQMKNIAAYLAK